MPHRFQPAPRRGQYDRRQPREARLLEQRERLITATALASAREEEATISAVVKLARVSRNTFYEYFDDLAHARRAAVQRAKHRLEQALLVAEQSARTPVERWRALVRAWFTWIDGGPAEAQLVLEVHGAALSDAGSILEQALRRSLGDVRAFGVRTGDADGSHLVATAAVGEAFGRQFAARRARSDDAEPASERERVERALVDIAVRVLR